jgi:NTP pyrophosphatase (non-canonical NTP hydrolase)
MKISKDWRFVQLQQHLSRIYNRQNRNFDLRTAAIKMARHATIAEKSGGKDAPLIINAVVLVAAWGISAANSLGLLISDRLAWKFPGVCPYCVGAPCGCKPGSRADSRSKLPIPTLEMFQSSIAENQRMMASIYPGNTFESSMRHLVQETAEFGDAALQVIEHGDRDAFANLEEELIDVLAHCLAIANTFGFSLIEEFSRVFEKGCPGCSEFSCACPSFVPTDRRVHSLVVPRPV